MFGRSGKNPEAAKPVAQAAGGLTDRLDRRARANEATAAVSSTRTGAERAQRLASLFEELAEPLSERITADRAAGPTATARSAPSLPAYFADDAVEVAARTVG